MENRMKERKRGFTLLELLIVVAIIGILVAIAVPAFGSILEKSRETADIANIRSAYTTIMTDLIGNTSTDKVETVALTQSQDGWQTNGLKDTLSKLGKVKGSPTKGGSCKVSWSKEDECVLFEFDGTSGSGEETSSDIAFPGNSLDGFINAYARLLGQYANAKDVLNDSDQSLNTQIDGWSTEYQGHRITVMPAGDSKFKVDKQIGTDKYEDYQQNKPSSTNLYNGTNSDGQSWTNNGSYWTFMEQLSDGQYKPIAYAYQINVKTGLYSAHNEVHIKDMSNNEIDSFTGNYVYDDTETYVGKILNKVYG